MPLIAQHTIEKVFEAADIESVVSQFVDLKKSGSSLKAKSPFTDEKTPSFCVSPSKNVFNCFSSGKGGGPITFLREHKGMSYVEAIEYLAELYTIPVDYEQESEAQKQDREKKELYFRVRQAAVEKYIKARKELADDHPANDQLSRFTDDSIQEWKIGFAPDSGKYIYELCREKGLVNDAHSAGLLSQSNGQYHDHQRDRIIFPIYDHNERLVGFSGRIYKEEHKKKYAKYLNSKSFSKDQILFGLHLAKNFIHQNQVAILCEGFTDVIALHEVSMTHAVCSMGASLSTTQTKLLSRYAKKEVIILRDGDDAGMKAAKTDMEMLLKAGLKASIVVLDGIDPYDLCHHMEIDDPQAYLEENKKDALMHFSALEYEQAKNDAFLKNDAINQIAQWLKCIENFIVRDTYTQQIAKALKIKVTDLKKVQDSFTLELKESEKKSYKSLYEFPESVEPEEAIRYGFYEIVDGYDTGYYFMEKSDFIHKSNFVITPIFHNYDTVENARIIKMENGIDEAEYVEMPEDALISVAKFMKFAWEKGAYQFRGNTIDLQKIITKIMHKFSKAYPLKTLGWQNEGFFAYYNCIYNGTLSEYDKAGLVKHDQKFYFSPGSSEIYKNLRDDDDMFENDKFIKYTKSELDFNGWAKLIHGVYGEHAYAGVPFVFVSLFRDIVFKVDNNCPFLYCYGQSKSGKSKFAESIMNLFFNEMPAFNLNAGTDFAFANRLARFKNCPVFFNEFDDNVVKDEWFQALKGAYDGEGRERGKGGSKHKTEIQRVNCTLILVGQYLSTKDDNSVLSRSILRSFRLVHDRSDEQVEAYNTLKQHEKKGLSSILTEILPHREMVEEKYYSTFSEKYKHMSNVLRVAKKQFEERTLRNYGAMASMIELFEDIFHFPFTAQQYEQWVLEEIYQVSTMISESDILVDFWTTVSTLFDQGIIRHNREFVVQREAQVRIHENGQAKIVSFDDEKNIIYLSMPEVQKYYAKEKRKEGGQPIDKTSLVTYLKNREYYLGRVDNKKINGRGRSCYLFEMEGTGIDLSIDEKSNYPIYPPQPSTEDELFISKNKENDDNKPF
jgi:DNA primase catalytic core